jgi:hypothetical protein
MDGKIIRHNSGKVKYSSPKRNRSGEWTAGSDKPSAGNLFCGVFVKNMLPKGHSFAIILFIVGIVWKECPFVRRRRI